MMDEGRRIVDAARARGLTLRLLGGLGVRAHCKVLAFCDREYADVDMVGLSRQAPAASLLMEQLGYHENPLVRQASDNAQRQFHREGLRVDVFLDSLRMDHEIPLKERLELDDYSVSPTDLLLTKLQVFHTNEKDVRDALTLLKDTPLADGDVPGAIDAGYIAQRCAGDWGLFYDVERNLELCRQLAGAYDLSEGDKARVDQALERLGASLRDAPKSLAWRLRARVGTRLPWRADVEGQDAV